MSKMDVEKKPSDFEGKRKEKHSKSIYCKTFKFYKLISSTSVTILQMDEFLKNNTTMYEGHQNSTQTGYKVYIKTSIKSKITS